MITTSSNFSHGVFTLYVKPTENYGTDPGDLPIKFIDIKVYEFDPNSVGTSDPYVEIDNTLIAVDEITTQQAGNPGYIVVKFPTVNNQQQDRLIRWVLTVSHIAVFTDGTTATIEPPGCCANVDNNGDFVFEGYAVDLSNFEESMLRSIKLQCNDCDAPKDLINNILKYGAIHAAVDSRSPYLEMIFAKLVCHSSYQHVVHSLSRGCGCNG